ncbi:MAG: hypothetical protein RIG68_16355 [Imperialibacter sp.]|uniref:DinB family protein n=1 Tax=Imperialibacter sp. TaxID=2038411 RepID=UPI0032EF7880
MLKSLLFCTLVVASQALSAQTSNLPYYQIPDYPASYGPGTVAARMVDGLGFRYYWATEGLRAEDLAWSPGEEARSSMATVKHIHGLSQVIVNATRKQPNVGGEPAPETFEALRKATLLNIQEASQKLLTASAADLESYQMVFGSGDKAQVYPFWNVINGPIADALWHVGQVVTFRRSSGNPLPKGVGVLEGKKFE